MQNHSNNILVLGREQDRSIFGGAFITNNDPILRFQYYLDSFFESLNHQAFDVFQVLSPKNKGWKDAGNQFIQIATTQLFHAITNKFPVRITDESILEIEKRENVEKERAFKYITRKEHFENCTEAKSKSFPLKETPEDWIKRIYDSEKEQFTFDLTIHLPAIFTKAKTFNVEFNDDGVFQNLNRSDSKYHLILYRNLKWEDLIDSNISTLGLSTDFYFWIVEEIDIQKWVTSLAQWVKTIPLEIAI